MSDVRCTMCASYQLTPGTMLKAGCMMLDRHSL